LRRWLSSRASGGAGHPRHRQRSDAEPFRYVNKGTLATIGRNAAVVQMGRLRFTGFIGWVTWLTIHLILLINFRSRVLVLINWAYDYFFYDRPVRLIVRAAREARESEGGLTPPQPMVSEPLAAAPTSPSSAVPR
jgi:hypothetical protein